MTYPLMIGETTFEIECVVSATPTRDVETGEPRLDLYMVQGDGSETHVLVTGDRAVAAITDIRRRRLTVPGEGRREFAA